MGFLNMVQQQKKSHILVEMDLKGTPDTVITTKLTISKYQHNILSSILIFSIILL